MKLTIADAAKEAGITRQYLYKMRDAGKISFETDAKGKQTVDSAELYRVFPPVSSPSGLLKFGDTQLEDEIRRLKDQVAEYRDREQRHLGTIDQLTRLLEHRPATPPPEPHQDQPRRGFFSRLFGGAK